jgi:SAM-dependent methyltransferase
VSPPESAALAGYDDFYKEFDSPLTRQLRGEAYGRDIGQHSWVTATELEGDIERLQLAGSSRLLDLGCGPGGPLAFVAGLVGCRGSGADVSAQAIASGQARAASQRLERLLSFQQADLNESLPFENASFEAAMSLDVILHLRDRGAVFREVARVLIRGGKFLFTDPGVITAAISDSEIRLRSVHGHTQLVPPGYNERLLKLAEFRLLEVQDRTASLLKNANGRYAARLAHREELGRLEGAAAFDRQQQYLATVIELSHRGALSRVWYLAESRAGR